MPLLSTDRDRQFTSATARTIGGASVTPVDVLIDEALSVKLSKHERLA
jgi:hypothetical protein